MYSKEYKSILNPESSTPICALATKAGGAIAVIRVSGNGCIGITDKVFRSLSGRPLASAKGYTLHYGQITDAEGETVDDVMVCVYHSPHSYTGEDCIEISCHGSRYIIRQILNILTDNGCRQAGRGEFTKRAYLNGKMDLSQAEAVADIIAADNKATHHLAMSQLKGHFSSQLSLLRDRLLKLTSLMELELDFSDHEELEFADRKELRELAEEIDRSISSLADSFRTGQALKEGIPVAIIGRTNVGKSTLLNQLLHEDKAIVSDIDGTTRDVIEDTTQINGVTFRFIDTAGIRHTDDKVELIGIERAYRELDKAAIVLWIIDSKPTAGETADIMRRTEGKQLIVVHNKADLSPAPLFEGETAVVARSGENIPALQQRIYDAADIPDIDEDTVIITNARHYEALNAARASIERVLAGMAEGLSGDLLSEDLRQCLDALGDITGGTITPQETLNNIFSHFCIGK